MIVLEPVFQFFLPAFDIITISKNSGIRNMDGKKVMIYSFILLGIGIRIIYDH